MRMRMISEVSHEIMKLPSEPVWVSMHANWIRNEVSLCEEFIDEMMRATQASEPPDIARHAQAHRTFKNLATNESRIILPI